MYRTVWRSFLAARSQPFLARINPEACRHVSGGSPNLVQGGVANKTVSSWRRYYSDWSDDEDQANATVPAMEIVNNEGGTAASWHLCNCNWCGNPNRLVQPPHQPHLYIVIDDWAEGFSIHKIDLEDKNIVASSQANLYQRLPPPAFRMEFSNVGANTQIAAVGSKIVACNQGEDGVTVVYDTSNSTHSVLRRSPDVLLYNNWQAAVAAGNKLYALTPSTKLVPPLDSKSEVPAGMYCLQEHIEHPKSPFYSVDMAFENRQRNKWRWSTDPLPLPFDGGVCSYALHPDGNTIFLSVSPAYQYDSSASYGYGSDGDAKRAEAKARAKAADAKAGTYSYDTRSQKWTHLGTERLPFNWEACYDSELDAWVGLASTMDRGITSGLFCCDVIPSSAAGGTGTSDVQSSMKLGEHDISSFPTWALYLDTKLVSMGGGRFCLVESGPRPGVDDRHCWGDGDKILLQACSEQGTARMGSSQSLIAGLWVLTWYPGTLNTRSMSKHSGCNLFLRAVATRR